MKKLRNIVFAIIIVIVALFAGEIAKQFIKEAINKPEQTTPGRLNRTEVSEQQIPIIVKNIVKELDKNTPMQISKFVRWDRVANTKEKTITNFYTFTEASANEVNVSYMDTNEYPNLKRAVCREMQWQFSIGLTYEYVYSGNDAKVVKTYEFNKQVCGL